MRKWEQFSENELLVIDKALSVHAGNQTGLADFRRLENLHWEIAEERATRSENGMPSPPNRYLPQE